MHSNIYLTSFIIDRVSQASNEDLEMPEDYDVEDVLEFDSNDFEDVLTVFLPKITLNTFAPRLYIVNNYRTVHIYSYFKPFKSFKHTNELIYIFGWLSRVN